MTKPARPKPTANHSVRLDPKYCDPGRSVLRSMFLGLLMVVLGLALVPSSFAQTFGEITGVVTDTSSAVVAGATVTVTNTQTNATRTAITNNVGNYSFPALQPGIYNVKIEVQGFQPEIRSGVVLQVQQVARLDFQLSVGAVTTAVEVTGGAPLLATENATVGTVIENQRILDLPLNGRNFTALIALSPNVAAGFAASGGASTRQGGDRTTIAQIAVSGQRQVYNYYTLDGIINTDPNFNTYTFLPSIDAIQEFKVQTGIYSAEFGHQSSQINVSTKSGTNQYHGTLFDFVRNNDFDARPFGFTSSVPASAPFKWNQFGFTLGGPIQIPKVFNGKDRLFFMSNYEGFRLRNQTQTVYSTPPVAMRNGDFSQILPKTVITDPLNNNAPFPGNMIPSNRFGHAAVGLLAYYPAPNIPRAGLSTNYLALDNDVTNKDQFTQRIDFVESTKSTWYGRYSFQNENAVSPALDQNGTLLATGVQQGMMSNIRILSPNWVNEFRFGYAGFYNNFGNELQNEVDVIKNLGIGVFDPQPAAWGTPGISITGFSGFGTSVQGPWIINDHNFQWSDNMSWTHGRHSVKFGAEIRRDQFNELGTQDARAALTIQNQATGYGFSDYMLGYLEENQDAAALAVGQYRSLVQSYYIDDNWKLKPNLTIDVGLRYEYDPPWSMKNNTEANVYVPPGFPMNPAGTGPAHYTGPPLCMTRVGSGDMYAGVFTVFNPAMCTARDGRMGDRLVKADYKNFAPRLGIAWSPSPKWTIRTGVGIFYVQDTGNPVFDMARNLFGNVQNFTNILTHNLTFENPFNTAGTNPCDVPSPPYTCLSTPQGLANQYNRRTPYTGQVEFNVQRQLTANTVVEVGYLGSMSHFLQRFLTLNMPATMSPTATVDSRELVPAFGNIQYVGGVVNANYNALTVKVTRRLSQGLTFLVGYTFAKSIDEGSGIRNDNTDQLKPPNGTCFTCERGLSSFDARNRLVISALYNLPFGRGQKFLNQGLASTLIGGWQISTIWTMSGGFPNDIQAGVDQSNTGEGYDRPNAVYGVSENLPSGQRSTAEWFNRAAFALQPKGTFGNLPRNTVTGPGIFTFDSALLKNFNFTERTYLQMRFEAFNTLNHPNFNDPNDSLTSATFGQITSTRTGIDMRELQLSMKLVF